MGLAEEISTINSEDLRSIINNAMRASQNFKGPFDVLSSKDKNNQLYEDAKNSVIELSDALKPLTSVVNELGKSLK